MSLAAETGAVHAYLDRLDEFDRFRDEVVRYFEGRADLTRGELPILHSIKSRLKAEERLREKIARKGGPDPIHRGNVFHRVTDLVGVRLLYLLPSHFAPLHAAIMEAVESGLWVFHEAPVAYTSDLAAAQTYRALGLEVRAKKSGYASVHYVVRSTRDGSLSCEIQVRTLFEETWLELDHATSYARGGASQEILEQLRALSDLASEGARLAERIALEAAPKPSRRRLRSRAVSA